MGRLARGRRTAGTTGPPSLRWRIATLGGLGHLPLIPGTAGSLAGAALCVPLLRLPAAVHLAALAALVGLAVWASAEAEARTGESDPPVVIIDEMAGMWVAALFLPATLYDLGAACLLFRLFDAVKPGPLERLERLPGGWGIVLDDLAAGLLARATWWLLQTNFDFL